MAAVRSGARAAGDGAVAGRALDRAAVSAAAEHCRALLEPALGADWSARVPGLDFTVARVVAHAAEGLLWYAVDVTGGRADDAAFRIGVDAEQENAALLASLLSAAGVCAATVDAASPEQRGFHPSGVADRSGFAAMACGELLVHAADAARGHAATLIVDHELAARVLERLFAWHESADDPWETLLWANGRIDLAGRERQVGWRWHRAPLREWDGRRPPAEPTSGETRPTRLHGTAVSPSSAAARDDPLCARVPESRGFGEAGGLSLR